MALQAPIVTVDSVTTPQKNLYRISFRMVADDDTAGYSGINAVHFINYRPGDEPAAKVSDMIAAFQDDINNYTVSKQLQESAGMASAVAAIQNGLVI